MTHLLTIAGSDPSGGAGLQQDLKVFTALGAYGSGVVTALTVQNTLGVKAVKPVNTEFFQKQLEAVLEDISFSSIKTGMLATVDIVKATSDLISSKAKNAVLVVDPVILSKNGHPLLSEEGLDHLKNILFPLAHVITPNIPEAEKILGVNINGIEDMRAAAMSMLELFSSQDMKKAIIIKGGHMETGGSPDFLAYNDKVIELPGKRLSGVAVHGTGCTFSSSLACFLGKGMDMEAAAAKAKEFTTMSITGAVKAGKGIPSCNPLAFMENELSRFKVLNALDDAFKRLSSLPSRPLVPEVQMNIGYALPFPASTDDVAAFKGRIAGFGDGVARLDCPSFGASSHVARIILTVMEYDRNFRAAMNIRYDSKYLIRAKELGYSISEFSRKDEPEDVRHKEGSTLVWGVKRATENAGKVPDIIYDQGAVGKEPIIRILGKDPMDVVEKAVKLSGIEG
jgi:hydroxymethylpyrimidine/phosphomethylpyrimidine kinase